MKLGIFIPAHNEEQTIEEVLSFIPKHFAGFHEVMVFVIDDGSTDETAQRAMKAGAQVITLMPNRGLAAAFKIGLKTCLDRGADVICHLDADNQYKGQEIGLVIGPVVSGEADLVTGNRQVEKLAFLGWARKYGNLAGSWFLRAITGMKVKDASSGFRAYNRHTAEQMEVQSTHTYTHETLIEAYYKGFRVKEVNITFGQRGLSGAKLKGSGAHVKRGKFDANVSRLTRSLFKHIFCSFRDILKAKARYSKK